MSSNDENPGGARAVTSAQRTSTGDDLRRWRIGIPIFFAIYLAWTSFAIGLRSEHFVIVLVSVALFFINDRTARFAIMVLPFLGVGILYDNLRLALDLRAEIHVADLYASELRWFGVAGSSGRQTLPEYFFAHNHAVLDFICGLAYLVYLAESFLFAIVLFFKDQPRLERFAWTFLLINVLGIATYLIYPAAPPWYVMDYGLGPAVLDALPSPAGTARFDELLNVTVFKSFYSRNANVFGAMPSLHCAYPTGVVMAAWTYGRGWRAGAIAFALLVCFSAVYLSHHYVFDVLAGIVYGAVSYGLVCAVFSALGKRAEGVDDDPSDSELVAGRGRAL